jgi:hypothetical protein
VILVTSSLATAASSLVGAPDRKVPERSSREGASPEASTSIAVYACARLS